MATSHKLTNIVKTNVPDYLEDALNAKARLAGCGTAEYLRDLIAVDVLDVTFGEHVANSRRAVMGWKGLSQAQKRADE